MASQLQIAQRVTSVLKGVEGVKDVCLRGSLSSGRFDGYSDVDLRVDASGRDNAELARTIISVIHRDLDVYFHDWATALLPEEYVISFYLKNVPLFWQVDISCCATPHVPTITRESVNNDPVGHLIKLWVINAKYVLRGGMHESLSLLTGRVLGADYSADTTPAELLRMIIGGISRKADGRFAELIGECQGICDVELGARREPAA